MERHRARGRCATPERPRRRPRHETQTPVHLAESPLNCVAVGSPQPRGVRGDRPQPQEARPPPLGRIGRGSQPAALSPTLDRSRAAPGTAAHGSRSWVTRSALQADRLALPQCHRRQAANRGGRPRAALARPDHRLLPSVGERRAHSVSKARARVLRPSRSARPRRRALPRQLRLVHRLVHAKSEESSRLRAQLDAPAPRRLQHTIHGQQVDELRRQLQFVGLPDLPRDYDYITTNVMSQFADESSDGSGCAAATSSGSGSTRPSSPGAPRRQSQARSPPRRAGHAARGPT